MPVKKKNPKPKKKPVKLKKADFQRQNQNQNQRVTVNLGNNKPVQKRRARASAPAPSTYAQQSPQVITQYVQQQPPLMYGTSPVVNTSGFAPPPPMTELGTPISMGQPISQSVSNRIVGEEPRLKIPEEIATEPLIYDNFRRLPKENFQIDSAPDFDNEFMSESQPPIRYDFPDITFPQLYPPKSFMTESPPKSFMTENPPRKKVDDSSDSDMEYNIIPDEEQVAGRRMPRMPQIRENRRTSYNINTMPKQQLTDLMNEYGLPLFDDTGKKLTNVQQRDKIKTYRRYH